MTASTMTSGQLAALAALVAMLGALVWVLLFAAAIRIGTSGLRRELQRVTDELMMLRDRAPVDPTGAARRW